MSFTKETLGTSTFLTYEVSGDQVLDPLALGMLTNNKIPGLAELSFAQHDDTRYLKYNVSSRVPVSQFFSGTVRRKNLLSVFDSIIEALLSVEDYMLDANAIILDPDYIFADVSTGKTVMICLPVAGEKNTQSVLEFFKGVMFQTKFDERENTDHVARIISFLNSGRAFSLPDFQNLIQDLAKEESTVRPPKTKYSSGGGRSQPPVPTNQAKSGEAGNPSGSGASGPVQSGPVIIPNSQSSGGSAPPKPEPRPDPSVGNKGNGGSSREPEQEISLFWLLQHYNKENAQKYKEQQERKKHENSGGAPAPGKKSKKAQPIGEDPSIPFAIPGQEPVPIQGPVQPVQQNSGNKRKKPVQQQQDLALPVIPIPPEQNEGEKANFGDTVVLGGGKPRGETSVLDSSIAYAGPRPMLVRLRNNERIAVNKPDFRIGKERSYVDYFVADNPAVSRSHAIIHTRNGAYTIEDTNSTNHTYINGAKISSGVETKLNSGDHIRLGNEEFDFLIV